MINIIFLFIISSYILPQELVDQCIERVLQGDLSMASERLPEYMLKYPNHPGVIYLSALLEIDGDIAKEKFSQIYSDHKGSKYSDNSIIKVSEYYYTAGLYLQSAEWLKKIPQYYSKSEYLEKSIKLFINSLVIADNTDSAVYYSKIFKKQYPAIKLEEVIVEVKEDYEKTESITSTKLSKKNSSKKSDSKSILNEKGNTGSKGSKNIIVKIQDLLDKVKSDISSPINEYSLQIGAFGKKSNAEYQKQILLDGGYASRIESVNSNGILLYIVRVGYFSSQEGAKAEQKSIQSRLAINSIVIKNE